MGTRSQPFRGWTTMAVAGGFVALLAATVAPGSAVAQEAPAAASCDSLYQSGDYEGAAALARSALADRDGRGEGYSAEAERILQCLVRARISGGARADPEFVALGERLLELSTALHGPDHPDLAVSQVLLGKIRERAGDYAAARTLYERALATRAAGAAPADKGLADILVALANLRARLGDYEGIDDFYAQAIAIYGEVHGPRSAAVANTLGNYAIYKKLTGDHAGSLELYQRALGLQVELHGREHAEVARLQYNLGNLMVVTGDFAGAREAYLEALAIREKVFGPESVPVARTLDALALLEEKTADLLEARRHAERALVILRRHYPEGHTRLAHAISVLASIQVELGDIEPARDLFEQVLAIYESRYGPGHPRVAEIISELGYLQRYAGDLQGALARFHQARTIEEEGEGDDDRVASLLTSEARALLELGRPQDARARAQRSVEIREAVLDADHPYLGWSLMTWGRSLWQCGERERAEPIMHRARGVLVNTLGENNPLCLEADYWYARTRYEAGAVDDALEQALQVERRRREFVRLVISGLPERLALLHSRQWPGGLDLALTLACEAGGNPAVLDGVWTELIRSRALVLDEMALRHRAASAAEASPAGSLRSELMTATRELAELLVERWEGQEAADFQQRYRSLRERRERIERQLGQRGMAARDGRWDRLPDLGKVAASLKVRDALVAYVRYDRTVCPSPGDSSRAASGGSQSHYAVLVLPSGSGEPGVGEPLVHAPDVRAPDVHTPYVCDLGPAVEIELLVRAWRDEAGFGREVAGRTGSEAEEACRRAGEALRARIWDPIASRLEGAERVYLVPDGPLHLVNLAALPADEGSYLLDRCPPLICLGTERDLVQQPARRAVPGELLALGAPDFSADCRDLSVDGPRAPEEILAVPATGFPAGDRYRDHDRLRFAALPASADEVATIVALWRDVEDAGHASGDDDSGNGGGEAMQIEEPPRTLSLLGRAANEAAFKHYAPGYRALHIATHGFFLGREAVDRVPDHRGVGGLLPAGSEPADRASIENPMLLSGLALAGANTYESAGPGVEDGILTAAEISTLDLAGVEWVVLSACESGVGVPQAGEGVLGLRRAFRSAGARTLVISLWPLADADMRDFMLHLYHAHLIDGLPLARATWAASRVVLEDRRAAGLDTHPHTWAGFIACGD